jgi:hypothetical protein
LYNFTFLRVNDYQVLMKYFLTTFILTSFFCSCFADIHTPPGEHADSTDLPSVEYPSWIARNFYKQPGSSSSKPAIFAGPEVRPFITDDARVVGRKLAQIETWFRLDKESAQQWLMLAYGPTSKLEISIGGVAGAETESDGERRFAYALPLVQAKFLFREYHSNQAPGVGMVIGSFLPNGRGSFKPQGYGTFGFLTLTQAFGEGERLLLHANTGLNYLHIDGANDVLLTWGVGSQLRTLGGFHLVGELFSGDPYVPGTGTAYQAGFRHFFSDLLQIDMTFGKGIAGMNPLPFWVSGGVRIVLTTFQK